MEASVYDATGASVGTVTLDDALFGITPNVAVMHQALVRQQANARQGTHDTKTRGEVSGGGKKPYRQKGTGRARQGSTRSPQWRGGGTVWGPHPRAYTQSMPRKMRHLAIRSALSARVEKIAVLTGLESLEGRTKAMKSLLVTLGAARSTLVVVPERWDNLHRAAGNLQDVKVLNAGYLNMADLFKYDRLLFTVEALNTISGLWGTPDYTAQVTEQVQLSPSVRMNRAVETADAKPIAVPLDDTGEAATAEDAPRIETTETEASE